MSTITVDTTLGDVVTAHPQLARELERQGLDYCCGGRRTIADASRAAGIDATAVVANLSALSSPSDAPSWATMTIVELVDHIESTHHRYLWDELPRLTTLLAKVVDVHGKRHPELEDAVDALAEIRGDLEPHLTKEERVLFPAIRELAEAAERSGPRTAFPFGSISNPISMMMREHDRAGHLFTRLHDVTDDYRVPADGCASYRACFEGLAELEADTHLHVHKENNLLFPAVVQLEERLSTATGSR